MRKRVSATTRQVGGLRGGLTRLTILASGVLALLIGLAFAFLLWAINDMRGSSEDAKRSRAAIIQAGELEKLIIDLETGQRGFVITRSEAFLEPWRAARDAFPQEAEQFRAYAAETGQSQLAIQITRAGDSLIRDYSIPLVEAARQNDPSAAGLEATQEGKRRVDELRAQFSRYTANERSVLVARQDAADANARRAVVAASTGLAGSVLLVAAFTVYQTRAIVRPIRRAAAVAEQLADGDLTVRMPTTATTEIGALEAAFNTMAESLQESRERTEVARRRLELLYDASVSVGTTLDMEQTARELVHAVVPGFADVATVDLLTSALRGEEPPADGGTEVRRVAMASTIPDTPLHPVGTLITLAPSTPQAQSLGARRARLETDRRDGGAWRPEDGDRAERVLDHGIRSLVTAPLLARGVLIGLVSFWRSRQASFEEDEVSYAEELAAKAAVAIDNARRYSRERHTAVTLQHSLLPQRLPEQAAVEVAFRYRPAGPQAGVGGDWFDVIPLSGTRVALVVGDVVGHGLHASATMGRLRTAVRTLADVDLPPDELLTHLDDLVIHLTDDDQYGSTPQYDVKAAADLGATCLYAVYDPVSRQCAMATAGHPLPAVVPPDGRVKVVSGHVGPPLGIGGLPFESTEFHLEAGSVLVLYTDGLVESRERDIDSGITELCRALAQPAGTLDEMCDTVTGALLTDRPADDVALLLARTRALSSEQVATWDIPADPAQVERARKLVAEQLDAWGLADAVFVTELVASELVTNAIRYGEPPIQLRVIRDRTLICEVSDASSTAPHLRRAREFDEGGRGLLLVSHLAQGWGTRQTTSGKTIWCEQELPCG